MQGGSYSDASQLDLRRLLTNWVAVKGPSWFDDPMIQVGTWVPMLIGLALSGPAEPLLAARRRDLPLYRRHLIIFMIVAFGSLIGAAVMARISRGRVDWVAWLWILFGAAVGLAMATLFRLRSRNLLGWGWQRGPGKRPDASRPLILVADPHWSEELVGLQAATRRHPEADWLFLGDVFDVWVGMPGMTSDSQRSFLSWVRERRRAGRWVGLWLGNREFFLDQHAEIFDLMGEGVGGGLFEEHLAFEHGDLINAKDWQYRIWNLISRSGPMWLFFRLLPGRIASAITRKLESQMRTTNRAYKLTFPRDAFRLAASACADCTFITGHFHTHEIEGNGMALPWAFDGSFMVWREGRVESLDALSDASANNPAES